MASEYDAVRMGNLPHWEPEDVIGKMTLSSLLYSNDYRDIAIKGMLTSIVMLTRHHASPFKMFRIFGNDVIHGMNIPVVGITAEVEPGVERDIWIRAPEIPGKYLIQCLNYCGVGHAQMKAWLVVEGEEA